MKQLPFLLVAALCAAQPAWAASAPNFVGTALERMEKFPDTTVSQLTSVSGQDSGEIFGGCVIKVASAHGSAIQDRTTRAIVNAIEQIGWTTLGADHVDPTGTVPRRLLLTAHRGSEACTVVVFFFPMQEGQLGISFTQIARRR